MLLLVLVSICVLVPATADKPLWDNGDPDMHAAIPALWTPEDARGAAGMSEVADDFENTTWWRITGVSFSGVFGHIRPGHDEPRAVAASDGIVVKIYTLDADGKPGEVFWSKRLTGRDARACQTLPGQAASMGKSSFRDALETASALDATHVAVEVRNAEGLVTLPPREWFVSFMVMRSASSVHPERGFPFYFLTSPFPRPTATRDRVYYVKGAPYEIIERRGGFEALPWTRTVDAREKKYNISFKIFGEELQTPADGS